MTPSVKVLTDGDSFAKLECNRVEIEFTKDGDSPNCPRSWTWGLWYDGNYIGGTGEEASLAGSVKDAMTALNEIIRDFEGIRDFLIAYGVFGREPEIEVVGK